ncbi:indole-3-glycerol-phosphate synthase [Candidatus Micrarchaeota archaeon]|nr:indole-3-glycerol-phosphate synthase [Candidatus Micrarchaeota archaeon]
MEQEKDILDEFISNAKESIANGYYDRNPPIISNEVKKKSLVEKLKNDFVLICEIKHASPAGEYEHTGIDARKTAIDFQINGADAISVVVVQKRFNGDLANISQAREAGLPIVFKDFIFTKKQIECAKRLGADVILLVVKVAKRTGSNMSELIDYAHSLGLEVLLECYDAEEFAIARKTNADILGINNRDLRTLKVNLARTQEILQNFPQVNKPVISESGIVSAEDVKRVRTAGASGVLVGTAIWKAVDLGEKIRELRFGGQ